jgi:multisubunit Na+/H+ antiporter MnhE subunit
MLKKIILFFIILFAWVMMLLIRDELTYKTAAIGVPVSLVITTIMFSLLIYTNKNEFPFLHIYFYFYILSHLNKSFFKVIKICFMFLIPNTLFISVLDYILLNKDSNSSVILTSNLITLSPGTIGILMNKRHLIVHSIDAKFFNIKDLNNIMDNIDKINDDLLV